ncbi:MAG: hypothetical protein MZW92_21080 [Comamonadaceae bacterium]|nr:hypothetical protein [Comamonadaceae bacterium]
MLGHLVHNALDATPPEGRVWVAGRAPRRPGEDRGRRHRRRDERGVRPQQAVPARSAAPSPAGMGIGSYESFQYLRELGGTHRRRQPRRRRHRDHAADAAVRRPRRPPTSRMSA